MNILTNTQHKIHDAQNTKHKTQDRRCKNTKHYIQNKTEDTQTHKIVCESKEQETQQLSIPPSVPQWPGSFKVFQKPFAFQIMMGGC